MNETIHLAGESKMVFSSLKFIFHFLPIFLTLYYISPGKWKNLCLFAGSLLFYFYGVQDHPGYLFLLFFYQEDNPLPISSFVFPIFTWCGFIAFFKHSVKCSLTVKTAVQTDIQDRITGIYQSCACIT